MSRSGYSDDCDGWALIRWRGAVNSAVRGKRGQAFLRELADALDAMPVKELVANELQADGAYCALGTIGAARGMDLSGIDPDDRERVAQAFGIAEALAAEIMFENDEDFAYCGRSIYPPGIKTMEEMREAERQDRTRRWRRVRAWVQDRLEP